MDKTKALKIILSLLVLGGLIFGVYYIWFREPATPADQTKIAKVVKGDITPTLTVTGVVFSENEAGLNFKASGKLTEVKVKVGDMSSLKP